MTFFHNIASKFFGLPCGCGTPERTFAGKPNTWLLRELKYTIIEGPTNIAAPVFSATVDEALSYWQAVTPPGFKFVRTDKEGLANILFRAFDPPAFNYDYAGKIIENSTLPTNPDFVNQCIVSVRKTANWGTGILVGKLNLLGALGHGIGHALGLDHDTLPGHLMSTAVGHAIKPTARDIARLSVLYEDAPPPAEKPLVRVTLGGKNYEGTLVEVK